MEDVRLSEALPTVGDEYVGALPVYTDADERVAVVKVGDVASLSLAGPL
tara:strand:- start:9 stop:155 length:147 start_codon:yes stop_codon:yes gene_type:complete